MGAYQAAMATGWHFGRFIIGSELKNDLLWQIKAGQ